MGQVAICCRLSGHTWRCLLITLVLLATEGHEAYLIHRNSESLHSRKPTSDNADFRKLRRPEGIEEDRSYDAPVLAVVLSLLLPQRLADIERLVDLASLGLLIALLGNRGWGGGR